jgi:hypothetical protein
MPNPPKPIEAKRRQGTYRPDRDPSRGALAVVGAVEPAELQFSAAETLESVLRAGVVWLASTDAPKVVLLREALEDYEALREARGTVPPKELRDARTEISKLMSDLGFDPAARARLGLAEVKAASKLEELRSKRSGG